MMSEIIKFGGGVHGETGVARPVDCKNVYCSQRRVICFQQRRPEGARSTAGARDPASNTAMHR